MKWKFPKENYQHFCKILIDDIAFSTENSAPVKNVETATPNKIPPKTPLMNRKTSKVFFLKIIETLLLNSKETA